MTLSREQIPVRCTLMRGGTSKAVFMRMDDVPSEPAARERFLLALFGSPDRRQIDGLGGADGPGWVVREVHFSRTVRRLMDGTAYIRRSPLEG